MTTETVTRITDETTKAELEHAITEHVKTMSRWPSHWVDRRAAMHRRIDAMLEDWQRAPESDRDLSSGV